MITYEHLNNLIERYATAVINKDAKAVANLFAKQFDHRVHGLNEDPKSPWKSKKEYDRKGIQLAYEIFFNSTNQLEISYINRIIDVNDMSAAMIVKVVGSGNIMSNALHIRWNNENKIIYFHNWYGL